MRVGALREVKEMQLRVALAPTAVVDIGSGGHGVVVDTAAGEGLRLPPPTPSPVSGA